MNDKFYRFEVYCSMNSGELEYVVKYFDLPIIASGSTIEEAMEEAKGNLEIYLEYCNEKNISIPEPSFPESINEYSGKITLRISKSLHKRIVEQSKRDGVSINLLLNEAITTHITKKESSREIFKETARELTKVTTEKAFELFTNTYNIRNDVHDYCETNKNYENNNLFIKMVV